MKKCSKKEYVRLCKLDYHNYEILMFFKNVKGLFSSSIRATLSFVHDTSKQIGFA